MSTPVFGTDGIRGRFGEGFLTPPFAQRVGAATARWLQDTGRSPRFLLGRDTRASGEILRDSFAAGVRDAGGGVVDGGIAPTPAVAWGTVTGGFGLGVVFTASHNPASDNGIKFFHHDGAKLTDEEESDLSARIHAEPESATPPPAWHGEEWPLAAPYAEHHRTQAPVDLLAGMRLVVDTANGATAATTPDVLRSLGAELELLGAHPDGQNINDGVGSEHPEILAVRVQAFGAAGGIAHDGDGDRVLLVDENGQLIDGDAMLAFFGRELLARGELPQNTLVATVMSNLGLDEALAGVGGKVVRTGVGDRLVANRMRADGFACGGENSGHYLFADPFLLGDGLLAALRVLTLLRDRQQPLSALHQSLRLFPQVRRDLSVTARPDLATVPGWTDTVADIEQQLGPNGRLLIRYSGTEPKLRVLVEASDPDAARTHLDALINAAGRFLPLDTGDLR